MQLISMFDQYITPELLIITPVLYVIARMLHQSHIKQEQLPWILLLISIVMAGLYTFATTDVSSMMKLLMALFTTIVQGVLLSGTAVFGGILGKLMSEKKN